ncbi:hypothetical protein Fleli_1310 [Bernardetia litoralis DSM 6794]|uniref:Uncharacterized protein n=1 Tax=Bernardetia litoralis (strain ATCC 23117 / DSM 6794 / NBRC 15988 / NCIMB 1366 / Fx l1 / Sio-4) TaxID=880071 RepID=I4AIF7_BERLS|nr:hypothetical protein [Bernardetia litoralis]AFM03742.1 hypothetical protein Fleli_1310 [Bernardetia litoralis DSM 6794]
MSKLIKLPLLVPFLFFYFMISSCTEIVEPKAPNPSSEIYTGNICFKQTGCNYMIAYLNDSSYILIDDYFNVCNEGDIVEVNTKTHGYDNAYNVTQNKNIKIYVDDLGTSEATALEEWEKACQTDDLYKEKGVVCFQNITCDYTIICLENGGYSLIKDYNKISKEGDIVVGRFESFGIDYAYNITQNKTFSMTVSNLEFSEEVIIAAWEDKCRKDELYKEKGVVYFKSPICDYMIVHLDNGNYSVVKNYYDDSNEGDTLIGKFESVGTDYAYNVTQDRNVRVDVKNYHSSENNALKTWSTSCADSEPFIESGTVYFKSTICDYMIVHLDNGNYSVVENYDNTSNEGDILIGKLETLGNREIYNVTQDRNVRVDVEDYRLSENDALKTWSKSCADSEPYIESGTVYFKSTICDYIVVYLDNGNYSIIENYDNINEEGDIMIGSFQSYGSDDAYNVTQDRNVRIYVEDYRLSENNALKKWSEACVDNDPYIKSGTVCFENTICNYMMICLDNGNYSIGEDYQDICEEGDVLIGRFQRSGTNEAYNITKRKNVRIDVDTWEYSESRAMEKWSEVCVDSEPYIESGTVCLKTYDCDYMIVCLDNGTYSVVEDYQDICNEGDILIGKFQQSSTNEVYNITQGEIIRIDIESSENYEDDAVEKWQEKCE